MSFFVSYVRGEPVYAERGGRPISMVMGFVLFSDGIGWCDDHVLQSVPSRDALHQLYGKIDVSTDSMSCQGITFLSVPNKMHWLMRFWTDVERSRLDVLSWHDELEHAIRSQRMRWDLKG